ncbi:MAG: ATPase, T2SS/T4P/T4SS family, partial [Pseudoalteromonas shioyasakiensis]
MSLPLNHFLQVMIDKKGSDLFVSSQLPVSAKVNGELIPLSDEKLSDEDSLALVESAMNDKQRKEFHDSKECNFAIATDEGRFRVSAFWQRDRAGMVIRRIVTQIPDVNELGLPSTLTDVIMAKRGLVLFVGGTGTGKSTSLAALLGYRNRNQRGHILT